MKKEITSQAELLAKAKEIAIAEGPAAINMRRLAESCNIALGTVYHYYPSKEALMADVIDDFWRNAFHSGACGLFEETSFLKAFEHFFQCSLAAVREFELTFLRQMVSLREQVKVSGGLRQEQYIVHIVSGLSAILYGDDRVKSGIWNRNFTPERFITMLMEEMLRQLEQGNGNPVFLLTLIERILYETKEGDV